MNIIIFTACTAEYHSLTNSFLNILENSIEKTFLDVTYLTGDFNKNKITILMTGGGKTQTAIICSLFLNQEKYDLALFAGLAGSLKKKLTLGNVVFNQNIFDIDYGVVSKDGFTVKPLPFYKKKMSITPK